MPSAIFSTGSWPRQLVADFTLTKDPVVAACSAALGSFDLVLSFEVALPLPLPLPLSFQVALLLTLALP